MKLGFVVPTKDRPEDLRKLLRSLSGQAPKPNEVVVVDASEARSEGVLRDFPALNLRYVRHLPPCASRQRNVGVAAISKGIDLVGFLDDDVVLEPGAMAAMADFWRQTRSEVAGAAFNFKNPVETRGAQLKRSLMIDWLGLYSRRAGGVAPSGWQNILGTIDETIFVDWLSSGAAVWRRRIFDEFKFDEHFDGYSYLEDLEFSYSVSRRYKLAVVAGPGFLHFPSPRGRLSDARFGRIESANRLYFVRKHGLSVGHCYLGLVIRCLMSVGAAIKTRNPFFCQRAWGNVQGLFSDVRERCG
jgi:glycosyltransferase involved in cell wall biosynthesis